jgi:signal transduction histidine kinase
MLRGFLNWKTLLALLAIGIVIGTIFYSQYLAQKISLRERQLVEQWAEASQFLIRAPMDAELLVATRILTENDFVPIIETNEKDSIINYVNLDSSKVASSVSYLAGQLSKFKQLHPPVSWSDPRDATKINRYYYGESALLKQVRYFPIVQLCIVALFITLTIVSLQTSYRSSQNQVWAGMAKETAHQLGTPVSSLQGWVEMLREIPAAQKVLVDLEKDVDRLQLITDRFGKIGSIPKLERTELVSQISTMVDYMKKRAGGKIVFSVENRSSGLVYALISPPLFDWVIENLLKNALDAMNGDGAITVTIGETEKVVLIDVTDTGKGIPKPQWSSVFTPGFTTKKRGWGLGLSLSRRIIVEYHRGTIFIKHSEAGKGTTFTISLKK